MTSRWRVLLAALILILCLAPTALADDGRGGRVVFGDDFHLEAGQRLNGDLVVFGGDVILEEGSRVRGDVLAMGGSIRVAGQVEGNAFALGGDVDLRATALVEGDVMATNDVKRDPAATVRGDVIGGFSRVSFPVLDRWRMPCLLCTPGVRTGWGAEALGNLLWRIFQGVVSTMAMIILGVLVVLLVPGLTRTAADAVVAYPAAGIGVGLLVGLGATLAIPILVITCIGIPVALVGAIALAVAVIFGWIAAGLALGERLLAALRQEAQPLVAVALGILVLSLVSNLPCLGFLVSVVVATWGLGAAVLTRFGTQPYEGTPPRVSPPTAPPLVPPGTEAPE